jgi:hypothetical protein
MVGTQTSWTILIEYVGTGRFARRAILTCDPYIGR